MNSREFCNRFAQTYNVDANWAKPWIEAVFDCVYDVLCEKETKELRLPFIGVIKHDYIFPRRIYNVNRREFTECGGKMTLTYKPSDKLMAKIHKLPPDPELADAAKKRRRRDFLPQKVAPEDIELEDVESENEEDYDE